MENIKSAFFVIIFLGIILVAGYWAFFTLEPGSIHAERQRQERLEDENKALREEIEGLKKEIRQLGYEMTPSENTSEPVAPEPTTPKPTQTPTPPPTGTTYKHQTLINELEKLITDKIVMREGSRGTRVGTVQKFLNIYHKTSKKVDNAFGAGTKTDVINFQKAEGMTADGEPGPATYRKMIDWLKKQG
ncbi:MAG TPA: peptidoglycan-binding domain-containing protein [Candidatus Paceibacterota bacterium]|nr:peptidoglycan-binding domain-containing protein [Candidatus Paceibacterota bacterium]